MGAIGLSPLSTFCESNGNGNNRGVDENLQHFKQNEHVDEMANYDAFVPIFEAIYCNFIEENRALLEINICWGLRAKLESIYNEIQEKKRKRMEQNDEIIIMYDKNITQSSNNSINDNKQMQSELLNKEEFWELWGSLILACNQVLKCLKHSYGRCDVTPLLSSNR